MECVGITYKAGRIGQKLKAKVKNRGFAKVFSWMLRKLKEEKKLVLSNSWRKNAFRSAAKHRSILGCSENRL